MYNNIWAQTHNIYKVKILKKFKGERDLDQQNEIQILLIEIKEKAFLLMLKAKTLR